MSVAGRERSLRQRRGIEQGRMVARKIAEAVLGDPCAVGIVNERLDGNMRLHGGHRRRQRKRRIYADG